MKVEFRIEDGDKTQVFDFQSVDFLKRLPDESILHCIRESVKKFEEI